MKCFYGGTFMSREELKNVGINYPIKLEYYKTETQDVINKSKVFYGIEVIKTEYTEEVKTEIVELGNITEDEKQLEIVLDLMKSNKVTPITAEYIVEDFLNKKCN